MAEYASPSPNTLIAWGFEIMLISAWDVLMVRCKNGRDIAPQQTVTHVTSGSASRTLRHELLLPDEKVCIGVGRLIGLFSGCAFPKTLI